MYTVVHECTYLYTAVYDYIHLPTFFFYPRFIKEIAMDEIDEKLFALLEGVWTEEEKEEARSF